MKKRTPNVAAKARADKWRCRSPLRDQRIIVIARQTKKIRKPSIDTS
jgi:hypothetical protein